MKTRTWLAGWGALAIAGAVYLGGTLHAADRRVLLPGPTTGGHHSIEASCDTCHTPFRGVDQNACLRCHGDQLKEANDSHAAGKFSDPRNADRLSAMDVRSCVTCHREHVADGARSMGVTVPRDFCSHCHQDIGVERPDHKAFAFSRCTDAGCHNYHDNRALNADFLAKHLQEADLLATPRVPTAPTRPPRLAIVGAVGASSAALEPDAPPAARSANAVRDWEHSAHARASVNCSECHGQGAAWTARVDHRACQRCHADETGSFLAGVHGMRTGLGLSPLVPAMARLPMRGSASHAELGCGACHGAHRFDTQAAAVDACLFCHDDRHSIAFERSPHYTAWKAEQAGAAPRGSGVSCATCHMPHELVREGERERVVTRHDQSANLEPPSKMLRDACLHCHGLGFSIDALADPELRATNFDRSPTKHVESLTMVDSKRGVSQ